MQNSFLRLFAGLLAATMLLFTFAACAKDTPGSTDTTAPADADTTPAPETTESPYDANGYLKDDLPKDLTFARNGEPAEFVLLGWEHSLPEFDVEEMTGDVVGNAIYERNMAIEERLGISLGFHIIPGSVNDRYNWCNEVTKSVQANSQVYDAIAGYSRTPAILALNGMLLNLHEIEHLDFEKPWWPATLVELNTIGDNMFFISGDIATTMLYQMMVIIYNSALGTDLGLENPQQIALDGNWTLDKMLEMATGVYRDLDADGAKSVGDVFGLYSPNSPNLDVFFVGAGLKYVEPNADGELVISETFLSEKSLNLLEKLKGIYYNSNDGLYKDSSFKNNDYQSLFNSANCSQIANDIRLTDMEYSVLPAPKYDDTQETYYTCLAFPHSVFAIPLDSKDPDMAGAVLECWASEGYRRTSPAVFDTVFKYQYAQNPLDSEMFELVRNGVVFDIGRPFYDELGGSGSSPINTWRKDIMNNTNALTTIGATYAKIWAKTLVGMNEKLGG